MRRVAGPDVTRRTVQQAEAPLTSAVQTDAALLAAFAARDALAARVEALTLDLAETRSRPWGAVADHLAHRVLLALSRLSPPLPGATAARLARSAAKRDPYGAIRTPDANGASGLQVAGKVAADPSRLNVLVVTHDATRSGAPILALNLVRHLGGRYNVTVLTLRGGSCLGDFAAASVAVHRADAFPMDRPDDLVAALCAATPFAFAVVNSVESHGALAGLQRAGVPTVTLLHEFAALSRFPEAMDRIATLSDQIVFSATVTRDAAIARHGSLAGASVHVIAQGKCVVPTDAPPGGPASGTQGRQRNALHATLRPPGDDSLVVIGAGTVTLRKGVDLFIETARQALAGPDGGRMRFFWIGNGYAPQTDLAYSVYLQDQMQRSGISDRVTVLAETPFIEDVYALADIMLLPSRLDPLPNVGLDAMVAGLPVICFDRATGLAEQLRAADVGAQCVADYLDCGDMAARLLALAASAPLRSEVAGRLRSYAAVHLDFAAYAERIAALGLRAGTG